MKLISVYLFGMFETVAFLSANRLIWLKALKSEGRKLGAFNLQGHKPFRGFLLKKYLYCTEFPFLMTKPKSAKKPVVAESTLTKPKPIIATSLSGVLIKSEPWKRAHVLWFEQATQELNDPSVAEYAKSRGYSPYVDEVKQRLYPNLSERERTIAARERFFDPVCEYIVNNPHLINTDVAEYLSSLKEKYRLALITTNTCQSLEKILVLPGLKGLFDIVESSRIEEKDDKAVVFDRFIEKYGKPIVYIGGDNITSFDYCQKNKIQSIFANFEEAPDLENVYNAHSLADLQNRLKVVLK
jgi:phosphoglycolate phosphatase-like HAD superfamily hydrolase